MVSSAGGTLLPLTLEVLMLFHPVIGSETTQKTSFRLTAQQQCSGSPSMQTCLETDGLREHIGTDWDELHICRSQGIGPQTAGDYTEEKKESVRTQVKL